MKVPYASLLLAVACSSTNVPVVRVASGPSADSNRLADFEVSEADEPKVVGTDDFAQVLLDVALSTHDWSRPRPLEVKFKWHSIATRGGGSLSVEKHKAWADGIGPFKLPRIIQHSSFIQSPEAVGVLVTNYDRSEHDWNQEFAFFWCNPNVGGLHAASFWGAACDLRGVESAALIREYEAIDLYRGTSAALAAQYRIRRMHAITAELARRGDEGASRQLRDAHRLPDGSIPLLDVSGLEGVSTVQYGSCVEMDLVLEDGRDKLVYERSKDERAHPATVSIHNTGEYVMRMASPPIRENGAVPSLALLVTPAEAGKSSETESAVWHLRPYVQQYYNAVWIDPWSLFNNVVIIPQRCSVGFQLDLHHYLDGLPAGNYLGKLVYADGVLWSHDDDWRRFRCIPSQPFHIEVR